MTKRTTQNSGTVTEKISGQGVNPVRGADIASMLDNLSIVRVYKLMLFASSAATVEDIFTFAEIWASITHILLL